MSLVSLDDFNAQRTLFRRGVRRGEPQPNGIACPKCGAELFDTNPGVMLASNPPQKNIHCDACDYRGCRIA